MVDGSSEASARGRLEAAAALGSTLALTTLGDLLVDEGKDTEAMLQYQRASAQGDAHADYLMGELLYARVPVQAAHNRYRSHLFGPAAALYAKAATQGHDDAQYALAGVCAG